MLLCFSNIASASDAPAGDCGCYKQAIDLLSAGKQSDAEQVVFAGLKAQPDLKTAFFLAVLIRSRFEVVAADELFGKVVKADPNSLEGQTAARVVAVDSDQDTESNFAALDKLASDHPNDPLILWMVGVECRQLHKNRIGIDRYQKLLEIFDPGPVLVHQTYGNLLLDDGQAQAALAQYDIAIKMEPAPWDYNCRGNALMCLQRYDDADAAYKQSTELDPDYELAWMNWAKLCDARGDTQGAAEKRAKLAEIQKRRGE
jgi:tetratricopeptide (TPR) repeat protein